MTTLNLKSGYPSFWDSLQYVGLKVAGVAAIHRKTDTGGFFSMQIDGSPYTGELPLLVTDGGLRHRNVPRDVKRLFKVDVMPVLTISFPQIARTHSFRIALHFSEGSLTTFKMAL